MDALVDRLVIAYEFPYRTGEDHEYTKALLAQSLSLSSTPIYAAEETVFCLFGTRRQYHADATMVSSGSLDRQDNFWCSQ